MAVLGCHEAHAIHFWENGHFLTKKPAGNLILKLKKVVKIKIFELSDLSEKLLSVKEFYKLPDDLKIIWKSYPWQLSCILNRHMLNGSRIILKNVVKFSVENFESKYNLAKKVELQFQSAKLIRIVRNTQNWSWVERWAELCAQNEFEMKIGASRLFFRIRRMS